MYDTIEGFGVGVDTALYFLCVYMRWEIYAHGPFIPISPGGQETQLVCEAAVLLFPFFSCLFFFFLFTRQLFFFFFVDTMYTRRQHISVTSVTSVIANGVRSTALQKEEVVEWSARERPCAFARERLGCTKARL